MTSVDSVDVVSVIIEFLNCKKYAEAKAYLSGEIPSSIIFAHGWDLVLPIISALGREERTAEDIALCEDLLKEIALRGNPKEVIVSLLEHLPLVNFSGGFAIVLRCFQEALTKIPRNRMKFLDWALATFYVYVTRLPDPENRDVQAEEERAMQGNNLAMEELSNCLRAVGTFLTGFVDTVLVDGQSANHGIERPNNTTKRLLLRYALKFLGRAAVLDVTTKSCEAAKNARSFVATMISHISKLSPNLLSLHSAQPAVQSRSHGDNDEEDKTTGEPFPPRGVAMLAYLIFVENMEHNHVPLVYSNQYIFESYLQGVLLLLSQNCALAVWKGVKLATNMVSRLEFDQYSCVDLDNTDLTALFVHLNKVMITSPMKVARESAQRVVNEYFNRFDPEARYVLYCRLLQVEKHAGLRGLLLDLLRKDFHESRARQSKDNPFVGDNFVQLLKLACKLPQLEQTDILDHSDCILAVLNLLRYFAMVSQHVQDDIIVRESVCAIAEPYANEVKKRLDLTRAYYKAELEHNQNRSKEVASRASVTASCTKSDSLFPSLPPEQEAHVLHSALIRLDLVESVLVLAQENLKAYSKL